MSRIVTLVAGLVALGANRADAQVRASEQGTVSQVVNGTRITVDYARPQMRGRDSLFGRVVHWGETWTPGANWATTLEVDRDVTIEGQPLPKGKYSVWLTAKREGDWTLSFNKDARRYHIQRPVPSEHALSVPIKPEIGARTEVLTFSFPTVTRTGTVLQFQWGTTLLAIDIGLSAARPEAFAQADADHYTGSYRFSWTSNMGPRGETTFTVTFRDGMLRGHLPQGLWGGQPDFDLVRESRNRFRPLLYRDGKPFDAEDGLFEFVITDDRAADVRLMGLDTVFGTGKRDR